MQPKKPTDMSNPGKFGLHEIIYLVQAEIIGLKGQALSAFVLEAAPGLLPRKAKGLHKKYRGIDTPSLKEAFLLVRKKLNHIKTRSARNSAIQEVTH